MSCKCLPYGPLVILPALMTITAFVMTYAYTFDCMFFIGSSPDVARPQGYGLWYIQSVLATGTTNTLGTTISYMPQGCETFRQYGQPASELMDTPFRFARVMSMIAVLLSLCAMIATLLPMCLQFDHKSYFMASGTLGIILGIFSCLCFVALASKYCKDAATGNCHLGRSGNFCIAATVLWFIAGCLLCGMGNVLEPRSTTTVTKRTAEEAAAAEGN